MRKGDFSKMVVTKELWKRFLKEHPEHKLTWPEFYQNWLDIAETVREEAIYNPLGVKLEKFTGELKLQYLPHKFKAVDHATSTDLGQQVNHVNIAEKGKVAKIKWERRWAVKFNRMLQFYAFNETRVLNKMAAEHIRANPENVRVSRNTLGGISVWRKKLRK